MNIEVIESEKNHVELKIDNLTIAEVLRVYMNEAGADLAVWRREHPSKPLIFRVEAKDKSVKKITSDAVSSIKKDCEKLASLVKKK